MPLATFAGTVFMVIEAARLGDTSIWAISPIALVLGAVMAGFSISYMTPSVNDAEDDGPDRPGEGEEPDGPGAGAAGAPVEPPAPHWTITVETPSRRRTGSRQEVGSGRDR